MQTIYDLVVIANDDLENEIKLIDKKDSNSIMYHTKNFIKSLRPLINIVAVLIYDKEEKVEHGIDNVSFDKAMNEMSKIKNCLIIQRVYESLNSASGHIIRDSDQCLRLILYYLPKLFEIKDIVYKKTKTDILRNLHEYPFYTDSTLMDYYKKIKEQMNLKFFSKVIKDKFYVEKSKPILINQSLFYELTVTSISDKNNKFSRQIMFSKKQISTKYLVELKCCIKNISLYEKNIKFYEIIDWKYSIRPCELINLFHLIGYKKANRSNITRGNKEYQYLMSFMKNNDVNLINIIDFDGDKFNNFLYGNESDKSGVLFNGLIECRSIILYNKIYKNVIRYLLYYLRNDIIKSQLVTFGENCMEGTNLSTKVYPFCLMPFAMNLKNHITSLMDLYECIPFDKREDELLYRYLIYNAEQNGVLFNEINELNKQFENFEELVHKFNCRNNDYPDRQILIYKKYCYIKKYEDDASKILIELKRLSLLNENDAEIKIDYNLLNDKLLKNQYLPDIGKVSNDKIEILKSISSSTKLKVIQGPAGTGKTKLLKLIANIYQNNNVLFLAKTNTAVNNLKNQIDKKNFKFKTMDKYLNNSCNYDVIIIDECSTIDNQDFIKFLTLKSFKVLILAGDPFQIESIGFGNWFTIIPKIIKNDCYHYLNGNFRTTDIEIQKLWENIRKQTINTFEKSSNQQIKEGHKFEQTLITSKFSRIIDKSIFEIDSDNQIILTLNYDGLYGINNLNRILQMSNTNKSIIWNNNEYKVGDPILFNDIKKFDDEIYNNLKGRIYDFKTSEDGMSITFVIDVYGKFNKRVKHYNYEVLDADNIPDGMTRIKFNVNKSVEEAYDYDDDIESIIPFQIAYAVSIHKAQGLEYDSVKVIITDEVGENINMNIFYTAITRAKNSLHIYWSRETERKIIDNLKLRDNGNDINLLKLLHNDL